MLRVSHLITFAVAVASLAYSLFIILNSGTEEKSLNAPYLLLSIGVILLFISGWGLIGVARLRPATFALQVVVIGFLVLMLIVFMTLSWADLPQVDALFAGMGLELSDGTMGGGTAGSGHAEEII